MLVLFLFSLHICTFCLFPEPVCILTDVASTFPFGSLRTACQPGIYNDVNPVKQSCYNLFNAWTGSGRERWEIKLYGNKTVQVRMNGALLDQSESEIDACGAAGFGLSPRIPDTNHSIFELSFKASEGSFGVKLSSPGPSKKRNLFWGIFLGVIMIDTCLIWVTTYVCCTSLALMRALASRARSLARSLLFCIIARCIYPFTNMLTCASFHILIKCHPRTHPPHKIRVRLRYRRD